jgi:hypothetical protein
MHFLETVQDVPYVLYINGVQPEEILITKMPVALQSRVYNLLQLQSAYWTKICAGSVLQRWNSQLNQPNPGSRLWLYHDFSPFL